MRYSRKNLGVAQFMYPGTLGWYILELADDCYAIKIVRFDLP